MKQSIYDSCIRGGMTADNARHWATWNACSGHPGGWRVTRGYCAMELLEGKNGRPILFRSYEDAQKRAAAMEAAEEAGKGIRAVDSGSYAVSKVKYRRLDQFGQKVIWATVVDGKETAPYVVGFCRNRMKILLEEFNTLGNARRWAMDNRR